MGQLSAQGHTAWGRWGAWDLSTQEDLVIGTIHPSGLLTEPSSTRQGWGQPCWTDVAGTWPRSHQTEDVGLVFTPLVISNPPTHHGVQVVVGTGGPHPGA